MARIPIVDEQDNVIAVKNRDDVTLEDTYRVSSLWITNSRGDILLAQRAWAKSHNPGKWGTAVAGTVEEEETYLSNIIKEAEEELGLKGVAMVEQEKVHRLESEKHRFFCQWYTAIVNKELQEFSPQPSEVAAIRWFSPSELQHEMATNPDQFLDSVALAFERYKVA